MSIISLDHGVHKIKKGKENTMNSTKNNTGSTFSTTQKKLIIAEKPSLAMNIVSSIHNDTFEKKDGYYIGQKYIVTFVFGHLFEAYDIEDYTKTEEGWVMDILPFCPPDKKFNFRLKTKKSGKGKKETDPGVKKQFLIIRQLINQNDVDTIVNCGDSDREGEAIIRLVIRNANIQNKPCKRMWLPEQTPAHFRYALDHLDDAEMYDNLANEGFSRLYIDWLYGINLTRYVTLKSQSKIGPLRVGRVLGAIVTAIYNREMEIKNFVPVKFYICKSEEETDGQKIVLTSDKKFDYDKYVDAVEYCKKLNDTEAIVKSINRNLVTLGKKKMFSTTKLQSACSKLYDMSPDECLAACQKLYEAGYITYPRTDTEYIAESEIPRYEKIISKLKELNYDVEMKTSKAIFNSEKIISHSAITPTYKTPNNLNDNEKKVYDVIFGRFVGIFCKEDATVYKTKIVVSCGEIEDFSITGSILNTQGFLKYDKTAKSEDRELPDLKENQKISIKFNVFESQTRPPAHYSVSSFNDYLENPFSKNRESNDENNEEDHGITEGINESNDDDDYEQILKGVSIGTGATRAPIIKKAIDNKYITLKKKTYTIEPLGIYLVESMQLLGIDMSAEKTVYMTQILRKVYNGDLSIEESIDLTMEDLNEIFKGREKQIKPLMIEKKEKECVGECPVCHANVYENNYGYTCENNKKENGTCKFMLWKNDKYIKSLTNKPLQKTVVKKILKDSEARITAIRKVDKKPFEMMICMVIDDEGKPKWDNRLLNEDDFVDVGNCPICGGNVKENGIGFVCENNRKEGGSCNFILFKKDKYVMSLTKKGLSSYMVKELLKNGECKATGYSKKDNKPYPFFLILKIENGIQKWNMRFFTPDDREVLGQCPICKGNVYENPVGFSCENNRKDNGTCSFFLYKKDKFVAAITKKTLTSSQVKSLLKNKKVKVTAHKKDKPDETYSCYLCMDMKEKYPNWSLEFIKRN